MRKSVQSAINWDGRNSVFFVEMTTLLNDSFRLGVIARLKRHRIYNTHGFVVFEWRLVSTRNISFMFCCQPRITHDIVVLSFMNHELPVLGI